MKAAIIGAGVIGLAIARELARDGSQVTVLDPAAPGTEASWAAAGMLAPESEPVANAALQKLRLAARDMYPEYVRELERQTGVRTGFRTEGTLKFTPDGSVEEILKEREAVWRPARFFPHDYSIDNRLLVRALEKSCRDRGVRIQQAKARAVERGRVLQDGGSAVDADVIVNAAGSWASQIHAPGVKFEVRPVKGQMAAVMAEGWSLTYTVVGEEVYMVPRLDGRILVGATMEDAGYDKTVHQETIRKLLEEAARLVPKVGNARVVETWAGLRPGTPSGLPLIGPTALPGYYLAVGHLRNGILLAPITARFLAQIIGGAKAPTLLKSFLPAASR